jgi:BRCT domain type II-containing protein
MVLSTQNTVNAEQSLFMNIQMGVARVTPKEDQQQEQHQEQKQRATPRTKAKSNTKNKSKSNTTNKSKSNSHTVVGIV